MQQSLSMLINLIQKRCEDNSNEKDNDLKQINTELNLEINRLKQKLQKTDDMFLSEFKERA